MIGWVLVACQPAEVRPTQTGGIALGLFADDARYDYAGLIDEIADTGATGLLLAVPWSLPGTTDHALRASSPRSALTASLRHARSRGLATTVMPLVVLQDRSQGAWRGQIDPVEPASFWRNYRDLLRTVAVDAERAGAERLVIGSELNALESDPAWPAIADEVRGSFSGKLTYSANWDRYTGVPFWSSVDEIAVSAYFPVTDASTWPTELETLHAFADDRSIPLVVSEYGYPALTSAADRPWDERTGAEFAPELQAQLLDDALDALQQHPPAAHFLWNWFGTGRPDEPSFTPRGRPAARVVAAALSRNPCCESSP